LCLRTFLRRFIKDAVLLKRGANDETSKALLAFLKEPEVRAIIVSFGYSIE
jgi:hypothetical protein